MDQWTPGSVLIMLVLLVWVLGIMGLFDRDGE